MNNIIMNFDALMVSLGLDGEQMDELREGLREALKDQKKLLKYNPNDLNN